MENVYVQLKEKFAGSGNVKEIFCKEEIDNRKSKYEIYSEIAFGEVQISQKELQAEQH